MSVADALLVLQRNIAAPEHVFWPLDFGVTDLDADIRRRLAGHHQLTDAILLELAIRNRGRLATFDRGIGDLLDASSSYRSALEIIPAG